MTRREAADSAALWIDRLQLRNADIAGERLRLEELFDGHPSTPGLERMMVYHAAAKVLKARGARTNLHEIDEATGRPRQGA